MISYDVAIVGAGPAGLEAAIACSENSLNVVLIDRSPKPGGNFYRSLPDSFERRGSSSHIRSMKSIMARLGQVNLEQKFATEVWGIYPDEESGGWILGLHTSGCCRDIYAANVVLAPGAMERTVPFPGWTTPGVMTAGGVQSFIKGQAILPGKRFLLAGSGFLQLAVGAKLLAEGAEVVGIFESQFLDWKKRPPFRSIIGQGGRFKEALSYLGQIAKSKVRYRWGWTVIHVEGGDRVRKATVAKLNPESIPISGSEQSFEVDTVAIGMGFSPSIELSLLCGVRHEYDKTQNVYVPWRDGNFQSSKNGVYLAGDGAGIGGARLATIEGRIVGLALVIAEGKASGSHLGREIITLKRAHRREMSFVDWMNRIFRLPAGMYALSQEETIICRCEDVTRRDIIEAVRKGAKTINEIKALTRSGMGYCQGRTCRDAIARILEQETGDKIDEWVANRSPGLFTARPPIYPIPVIDFARVQLPTEPPIATTDNKN